MYIIESMNIGCHVPIAKGIEKAPEMAAKWGCEAMQIFTHPPQGGRIPELDAETVKNFKAEIKTGTKPFIHALITPSSENNRLLVPFAIVIERQS